MRRYLITAACWCLATAGCSGSGLSDPAGSPPDASKGGKIVPSTAKKIIPQGYQVREKQLPNGSTFRSLEKQGP